MKKTKLITNLCLLVLTLACLTFGVYSAVKTSFTASGTITFNAYGINLDIDMSFAGTETAIAKKYFSTHTDRSEHITSGQTYTDISAGASGLALVFDELTVPEGKTETDPKITIMLKVKNYSDFPIGAIPTLKFGASGAETTETFESTFNCLVGNTIADLRKDEVATLTFIIRPKTSTKIVNNNNFILNVDFVPYEYTSFYQSQGYTMLEDGVNCSLSNNVLSGYSNLTGVTKIMIPEGVTEISEGAFQNASFIAIAMPNSVTTIGQAAFASSKIQSIVFSRGITSTGYYALNSCSYLISFATTHVNGFSFVNEVLCACENLSSIVYKGTVSEWNSAYKYINTSDPELTWDYGTGEYTVCCSDGDVAKA